MKLKIQKIMFNTGHISAENIQQYIEEQRKVEAIYPPTSRVVARASPEGIGLVEGHGEA